MVLVLAAARKTTYINTTQLESPAPGTYETSKGLIKVSIECMMD